MKLSVFLLFIGLSYATANSLAQEVTISKSKLTFKDVFKEIKKQTGYNFLWGAKNVQSSAEILVDVHNLQLGQALTTILKDLPLQYEIVDKTILIKEDRQKRIANNSKNKVISSQASTGYVVEQQTIEVSGTVIDSLKKPISGVSIQLLNAQAKRIDLTRTDATGKFLFKNVPPGASLLITSLGYKEFRAVAKANMGILKLESVSQEIDEIVVTGIFERPAGTYTGAVNTLTAEDIKRVGNQNVLDVLSVLDPGIQMLQDLSNGSDPNKMANMRLRGASSIPTTEDISGLVRSNIRANKDMYNAYDKKVDDIANMYSNNPNLPLFVLDGFEVPLQRINDLDITEVNSITILKDASATAIYGSRGANGVIVVERIKPKEGTMLFGYKTDFTFSYPDLHDYRLLNAREKLEVEKLAGVYTSSNTDNQTGLDMLYNARLKEVLRGRDTYWPSLPLRNSLSQKHRVTMDGGSGVVNYGVDFSYNRNNGAMKGSSRTSYNGGINLSYRGEKIQIQNQLNVQFTDAVNSPWGSFSQYTRMNPYFSPYDENGNIIPQLQGKIVSHQSAIYNNVYNPVFNTSLNGKDFRNTRNLINNTALTYKFKPNLTLRGRLSLTNQSDNSEIFLPAEHTTFKQLGTDLFKRGAYTAGYGKLFSYDANLDLNYNLTIDKHQLFTTLSARANENSNENVMVQVEGLPSALTDFIFYGRKYVNDRPGGSESTIRTVGFLGNANYAYDNRYLLDFSYRLDGSSSVGADRLFAPFWSVGTGWNLHSESFLSGLRQRGAINQLRIRSSIGVTGAQQFDSYMAYRTYNYNLDESYLSNIGANLLNIGNDNLTWQSTRKFNLGLDISTLQNRLHINADYYNDFTDKFIADFSLPLSTGFSTYKGNLGAIKSKGYEVRASYQIIQPLTSKDFGLTLMANLGNNRTIVDKISDEMKAQNEKLQNMTNEQTPFTRYEEGSSIDAIWVVPSLGIDPTTGQELFLKKDGSATYIWDANDMVSAGVSTPKYRGTFGFNITYYGFQLNAYFSYRQGGQLFNQTLLDKIENVNLVDNADRRVLTDRWKQVGDLAYFKRMEVDGSRTNASSRFVQNDNSLDMTSASLLYRFDDAKVKRFGLRNFNVGFYMNDVFRLSSIKVERGLDYPFARNFSLSLQTSF
ncbi:SusC/RagA family TonB-linked outer membrane protein [Sphingobacterium faecale]|uniref:SusC/RagA family TonB-linked outer membrane protein n=1 Tax=Sphingobacterium faecale TaxID=2803775 RepID=A0ABS1R4X1_9SPHI|nr:SusC/RagA family TonB-linked outer membrane protein [Sphingobacterium faecale]MBL1408881.1 SusC/RagA family TonB-linked outer membrane protein [Sphingobacterium faecale]